MKLLRFTSLVLLLTVLSGCPQTTYKSNLQKIQDNNMDLPELRDRRYKGIRFKLSDLFSHDYNNQYVIKDDAAIRVIYEIDVNFSLERFDADEAELFQFAFEEEISALDAVHDNYVIKRLETFDEEGKASIKKSCPKEVKYPGYIQVLHGNGAYYGEPASYFMATLEIDGEYFVFQMIGKKENMGHLYDDFVDIIASVTK